MQAHILAYHQTREYVEAKEESEMLKAMTPKQVPTKYGRRGRRNA